MLSTPQKQSLLAILLTAPLFSLGILLSLLIAPGMLGTIGNAIAYLTFIILPIIWTIKIDQNFIKLPIITKQGWLTGLILGSLMAAVILATYFTIGQHWANLETIRSKIQTIGGTNPTIFYLGSFYFTVINAFIEEAVWRGFIYRKCDILLKNSNTAILTAALLFTIHHTLGLAIITQDWRFTLTGTIGVFAAGIIWSALYRKTRSLWPCYVSHVIADAAIAIVNWHLIFSLR